MRAKLIAAGVVALVALVALISLKNGLVGYNNDQDWQILQSVTGKISVIDAGGYYGKWFGTVWTYPRTLKATYAHPDHSIKVTFNDNGTAQIDNYVMVQLPVTEPERRLLHRDYQANPDNIRDAIGAHLTNVLKVSGPVMSASENQASRKSEFNQIVEGQLQNGLYQMRRTEIELNDLSTVEEGKDEAGNTVTHEKRARVQATEIVLDPKTGHPVIIQPSPLKRYGINVIQFSMTDIEYDKTTLEQFAAKKRSYLAAEQAKAERQEEVQQRLMIVEKGNRQVAEVQAKFNQTKEQATIEAQQKADVAIITKEEAVTAASQRVSVALQMQKEAETMKAIAAIHADTAELDKAATISAAEGKQKTLELGGGISEEKRVLAQIAADRDSKVAEYLAGVKSPGVVIMGGEGGHDGGGLMGNLINVRLLSMMGIVSLEPQPAK